MNSVANICVYNNLRLMTDFAKKPKIGKLTLDKISPRQRTIQIRLALEDRIKGVILNFCNIYYLLNSSSNLINLSFLNDIGIYYNNKQQVLYNKANEKLFAFIQQ